MKKNKNKNRLNSKLTGDDLRQIANFHAIIKTSQKMNRLLKEIKK